jgi:putative hydrolase of the HAD superfamily
MIKAIIFDCFGVLTTESFDAFRKEYFADKPDKRQQANQTMDRLNAGQIGYKEFLQRLAGLSGLSEEKIEQYLSQNTANKPLFDYIRRQLKPKYKIGVLSNAGSNWLNELFVKEDVQLFDDAVLSYEHRIVKPQPEIFDLAAQRLGVRMEECVFVDDHQSHCHGAVKAGMYAVWYQNFEQMRKDLEKILASGADDQS